MDSITAKQLLLLIILTIFSRAFLLANIVSAHYAEHYTNAAYYQDSVTFGMNIKTNSNMITEDYVSFETAKLLKEKGFESDECIAIYDLGDNNAFIRDSGIFDNGPEDYLEFQWGEEWRRFGYYLAPTLHMAMKWLREIHGLFIHVDIIREASCWLVDIQDIKQDVNVYPVKDEFSNYEEACEAAIKYCLENLI